MRVQIPQYPVISKKLLEGQAVLPKPEWLKIRPPTTEKFAHIKGLLKGKNLHTVCTEAHCPNITECWSGGTATFMLMGDTCTRACRFCMVKSGNPQKKLDKDEPQKLMEAIADMKLNYIVLTCVTRDDLPDGGAGHFSDCIKALKKAHPALLIEVLISDLNGNMDALKVIVESGPEVIAHNVETIERLQKPSVTRAPIIKIARCFGKCEKLEPKIYTKSSLMRRPGESEEEVIQAMKDLLAIGVSVVTFGQYLRPKPVSCSSDRICSAGAIQKYEILAKELGFLYCAAGPFVRSSYKAGNFS